LKIPERLSGIFKGNSENFTVNENEIFGIFQNQKRLNSKIFRRINNTIISASLKKL